MICDKNKAVREKLISLLGELPPMDMPITAELLWEEDRPLYRLQKLRLQLNGIEDVTAYMTLPKKGEAPYPVVVFNHSHGGFYSVGKTELLKPAPYMVQVPYAVSLAEAGIAAIAIDHWCFGERNHNSENDLFKLMLWRGQVMWGMMVYDSLRVVDYLHTRQDVDTSRIATLGMSMGSTMAWWLSALDERICACADIGCMTEFNELIKTNGLREHGIYYYVPSLIKHFTTVDINALIAPRPHFSVNGTLDPLTPIDGLHHVDKALKELYASLGAEGNWHMSLYDVPHQETEEARKEIIAFLSKHLNVN